MGAIGGCLKLNVGWQSTFEGYVARCTWDICECCNFTEVRLYRQIVNRPPGNGVPIYVPFPEPYGIYEVGRQFLMPSSAVFGAGYLNSLPIDTDVDFDWYVGPPTVIWGPEILGIRIPTDCNLVLVAKCCDGPVWMCSRIYHVRFNLPYDHPSVITPQPYWDWYNTDAY